MLSYLSSRKATFFLSMLTSCLPDSCRSTRFHPWLPFSAFRGLSLPDTVTAFSPSVHTIAGFTLLSCTSGAPPTDGRMIVRQAAVSTVSPLSALTAVSDTYTSAPVICFCGRTSRVNFCETSSLPMSGISAVSLSRRNCSPSTLTVRYTDFSSTALSPVLSIFTVISALLSFL